MIPDDIYWVPENIKANCRIQDIIEDNHFVREQVQFDFDYNFQQKEDADANQKHIEDEILEMLQISEEDLLLEAALQTYDHKLYIEELLAEALADPKQQQQFQALNPMLEQNRKISSSFKTLYERQYLSFTDTMLQIEEPIHFKIKDVDDITAELKKYCEDPEDLEDILSQITKKAHQKAIHRFCQLRGPARRLVFNYIEIQQKQNPNFNDLLVEKLKDLSMIDSAKTEQLLEKFSENQLKSILDKQIPIVRFKILQQIQKDDKLMIEYFELLCQLHPDQVIIELQKGGYPQDECLKLCRYYGNLKGLAYLLERSGSVLEAINLQFDLFIQSLKLSLQRNPKLLEAPPELKDIIWQAMKPTLDICRTNTKRNDDESDNNWFQILIRLTKLREEFYKIRFNNVLRVFNQIHTIALEEILEKTKIKSLLENLNETMKFFEFQELKSTFAQLLSGQQYELAIYGQSTLLIKQTANHHLMDLAQGSLKGTPVDIYCCHCQKLIPQVAKVFAECKHTFHIECAQEQLCKICVLQFSALLRKLLTIFTTRKSTRLTVPTQTVAATAEQKQKAQSNQRQAKIRKLKEHDHYQYQKLDYQYRKVIRI